MKIKESAYTTGNLNEEIFGATERAIDSFFISTRYFVTPDIISEGMSFLDIGGGGELCVRHLQRC